METEKPSISRVGDRLLSALTKQTSLDEYNTYGLSARTKEEKSSYISKRVFQRELISKLNPCNMAAILDDQWLFYMYYGGRGLPLPKALGVYAEDWDGPGWIPGGQALEDVVMKKLPEGLMFRRLCSDGLSRLEVSVRTDERPVFISESGQEMSIRELTFLLQGGKWIVQQRLSPHKYIKRLSPYGLNPLEVVTLLTPDGAVEIVYSILHIDCIGRVGGKEGDIAVNVDTITGQLGTGVFKNTFLRGITIHPNTREVFTGKFLPMWADVIDICKNAAQAIPELKLMAWTIVLTDNGPKLLAGSRSWDIQLFQAASKGFLRDGRKEILREYGVDLGTKIELGDIWGLLKQ